MLHVDVTCCCHLGKVASHGHHPKMLGRELNLSVVRVELPNSHRTISFVHWPATTPLSAYRLCMALISHQLVLTRWSLVVHAASGFTILARSLGSIAVV